MNRTKVVKKKTKNRETLLRNLRRGKARLEDRCPYQVIPHTPKYLGWPDIYRLYADVILMEQNNNLCFESSLFNHFKLYKQVQIVNYSSQRCLKFKLDNNSVPTIDWRAVVDKLQRSESYQLKQWVPAITNYCERYEAVIKQFTEDMTDERIDALIQANKKMEKIRQTVMKTYPCIEFKSSLKNGQIQITEMSFSEKYIAELGYDAESFTAAVFSEGIPEIAPLNSPGASNFARLRLEKYLTLDQDGFQTPEFETLFMMKGGIMKKTKLKIIYHTCYEKGAPGFVFLGVVVAKQKPAYISPHMEGLKLNNAYVQNLTTKEQQADEFLQTYYEKNVEPHYALMDKVCKIREIGEENHV